MQVVLAVPKMLILRKYQLGNVGKWEGDQARVGKKTQTAMKSTHKLIAVPPEK